MRGIQRSVRERVIFSIPSMSDRDDESRRIAVLEKAVENTNEAFVTIDAHHKVVLFNKAAEKIFGFKREEFFEIEDMAAREAPTVKF